MAAVDEVIVALEARVGEYNRKIADADRRFDRSMENIRGSATRTEKLVSVSFRAMAAAAGAIGLVALGKQAVQTSLDFKRVEQAITVATGSSEKAAAEFTFLRDIAERLGLRFITLAENYSGLAAAARGTNLEGQRTRDIFEAVTTAVVATGGSMEQAQGALLAVQQIISKGTVSAEELRGQLGERLPGAFQIAARAMGVTTAELGKLLESGGLVADEFLPRFAQQLRSELPQSVETADASFQRFQTALDDIANSTADGFMKELGDATDDLTDILKEMQASGALEAFGAFLGDVIRLGGGAVQALGELARMIKEVQNAAPGMDAALMGTPIGFIANAYRANRAARNAKPENVVRTMADFAKMIGIAPISQGSEMKPGSAGGALPPIRFAGGGSGKRKKGPRGKSAEQIAREAERAAEEARRNQEAFEREMFQAQQDILRGRQDLADDALDRSALEREMVSRATAQTAKEIQADERYSQAQKDALLSLLKRNEYLEFERINKDENQRIASETAELEEARLQLGMDLLSMDADLATTAKERRAIELKILDLAFQRERAQLEALAADEAATDAARQAARERLEQLPRLQAGAEASVRESTQGPLEAYLSTIPDTAAEMDEALEGVAANGLRSLEDGLARTASKVLKLGGIFGDVANQIIADLARIAIQQLIVAALPGGNLLSGIGSIFGRASGGHVQAGKLYRVNEGASPGRVEGFQPAGSGKIIPLGAMRGGQGGGTTIIHQSFTLDARYGITTPQLIEHVNRTAQAAGQQAFSASLKAGKAALPGQIQRMNVLGTP